MIIRKKEKKKYFYRSQFTDISCCFDAIPLFSIGQKPSFWITITIHFALSRYRIFGDCCWTGVFFSLLIVNCFVPIVVVVPLQGSPCMWHSFKSKTIIISNSWNASNATLFHNRHTSFCTVWSSHHMKGNKKRGEKCERMIVNFYFHFKSGNSGRF